MMSPRKHKQQKTFGLILPFGLTAISFLLLFSSPSEAARPATFWVTSLADNGPGSLRQAIDEACIKSGKDFIKFSVSGPIILLTPLSIGDPSGVVIDGFTAPPPGITLEGGGLCVTSSNNVIRGLKIIANMYGSGMGIFLSGLPQGVTVENNLIEDNEISGYGSGVGFNQASKNVVRNNVIVGNSCGIWFNYQSYDNDENVFEDNVIGDSINDGIRLAQGFRNMIRGNYIGLDRAGNPMPNKWSGVVITGYTDSLVPITGNNTVGPGNVIAFNNEWGVVIHEPIHVSGITITRNSIFDHRPGSGISLGYNPNGNLPSPTIVTTNPITGTAPAGSTVEIFFDGGDQGRFFVGSVKADDSGNFTSAYTLNGLQGNITSTATDQYGNTSMFSAPVPMPSMP